MERVCRIIEKQKDMRSRLSQRTKPLSANGTCQFKLFDPWNRDKSWDWSWLRNTLAPSLSLLEPIIIYPFIKKMYLSIYTKPFSGRVEGGGESCLIVKLSMQIHWEGWLNEIKNDMKFLKICLCLIISFRVFYLFKKKTILKLSISVRLNVRHNQRIHNLSSENRFFNFI